MRRNLSFCGLAVALLATILALASCGQPMPFTLSQTLFHRAPAVPPPPAPASASAVNPSSGADVQPNSWTNASELQLAAELPEGVSGQVIVEAQFEPEGQLLNGEPNITGDPGQTSLTTPSMEAGQRYHWEIRLREPDSQPGPWLLFPGFIGYQPTPPLAPSIPALPRSGWVGDKQISLSWQASGDPAGIAGYGYSLDQNPKSDAPAKAMTPDAKVAVTAAKDGDWYFHVRTIDGAGNASSTATLPLHVDSVPLTLQPVKVNGDGAFNPGLGPVTLDVKASKVAQLTLSVLADGSATAVRTWNLGEKDAASVQWDGKDNNGQALPPGKYRFRLDASDKPGRVAQSLTEDTLALTNKRIVVSLSQQRLVAYQGDQVFLDTLVTTGGPELPTPVGTFHILEKRSPFTFKSPWPKGSPFWYPDSPTTYAMLFEDSGYFIHDAPWRSWYGPGSNATAGTPGGNGTGTHGCVNVPFAAQAKLWGWTDVGTPVIVQN